MVFKSTVWRAEVYYLLKMFPLNSDFPNGLPYETAQKPFSLKCGLMFRIKMYRFL